MVTLPVGCIDALIVMVLSVLGERDLSIIADGSCPCLRLRIVSRLARHEILVGSRHRLAFLPSQLALRRILILELAQCDGPLLQVLDFVLVLGDLILDVLEVALSHAGLSCIVAHQ